MICPVPRCTSLPDCTTGMCYICEHQDVGERAAIQTEGQTMDKDAWARAVDLVKAARQYAAFL